MEDIEKRSYSKDELEEISANKTKNEIFLVCVENPLTNSTEQFFSDNGLDTRTDNNAVGVMYTAHSGEIVSHYVDVNNICHIESISEIQLKEYVNY